MPATKLSTGGSRACHASDPFPGNGWCALDSPGKDSFVSLNVSIFHKMIDCNLGNNEAETDCQNNAYGSCTIVGHSAQ